MDSSESEVHGCVKEQLVLLQDKGSIVIMIYDIYLQDISVVETINFALININYISYYVAKASFSCIHVTGKPPSA